MYKRTQAGTGKCLIHVSWHMYSTNAIL